MVMVAPFFDSRCRWRHVLANVNSRELTFTFAICCRPSVCRLSSVCLSSVTYVHSTQPVGILGNLSTPFGTLTILLRRSPQGNPFVEGGKTQEG